jgi:hypothetical protein
MTAILLRLLIIAIVLGAIYLGVRRIWRDWTRNFRDIDKERHQRDLKERKRPDVITLKRNQDGVFRPPGDDDRRA